MLFDVKYIARIHDVSVILGMICIRKCCRLLCHNAAKLMTLPGRCYDCDIAR